MTRLDQSRASENIRWIIIIIVTSLIKGEARGFNGVQLAIRNYMAFLTEKKQEIRPKTGPGLPSFI